jgi:hypothetical protein
MVELMSGLIPVPSNVDVRNVIRDCSTYDRESPFLIPRTGISIPVYLTHWSETISAQPLKQFEQLIYLNFKSLTLLAIICTVKGDA